MKKGKIGKRRAKEVGKRVVGWMEEWEKERWAKKKRRLAVCDGVTKQVVVSMVAPEARKEEEN